MTIPKVSVILPVRNGEQFLVQAIESALNQSFTDFELIAIDNGSTDQTGAILADFSRQDKRVRAITCDEAGVASASNAGLATAQGIYVARMDADDISRPDRLAKQVAFLDQHPAVGVVGGALDLIDAAGAPLGRSGYPTSDAEIRKGLAIGCAMPQPAVMMRTHAVREAGGYRAPFVVAEDYDLWLRLAERWQFANLLDVVIDYRVHARQLSSTAIKEQALCSMAARLAAKTRGANNIDPINGVPAITMEVLQQLGIGLAEVQCEIARCCLIRARFALANGWLDQGLALVGMAEQNITAIDARRIMLPEVRWMHARLRLRKKQLCAGLSALLQSFTAAPMEMAGRAWMAARRQVFRMYTRRAG